jgi:uroporphyrinogen decarboxylase
MAKLNVPLANPKPDYREFIKAVTTSYVPSRPRLVEYLFNPPIQKALIERMGRQWVDGTTVMHDPNYGKQQGDEKGTGTAKQRRSQSPFGENAFWDNFIAMWYHLGYDFVRLEMCLNFPHPSRPGRDRAFAETASGAIATWEDFEKYPWPVAKDEDFLPYEYVSAHMPDGMGLISCHAGGPLEYLVGLMGYEPLCIALHEQPDLVRAVIDRIEQCVTPYVKRLLQVPRMIAYFQGDDMGFRTGTLIGPDHLRKYTLPVHKRFAKLTHDAGLPYFLHSCGNVADIMPDLIDDVKIDGKHSVEDAIMPAGEWKKRYGGRIGILGGVDLDKLCRLPAPELRKYVRKTIDDCQPGGHFVIGSGNSIPDYVPVENLLTMLDEAMRKP